MRVKALFLSMIAAASLTPVVTGCEEDENLGEPGIDIEKSEISFEKTTSSQTIELTTTRDWTVAVEDGVDWVSVEPKSGKASANPVKVTVTVLDNEGYDRECTVTFGISSMLKKTLKVVQAGSGSASDRIVYKNDFDKELSAKNDSGYYPYLDEFDGWKNATGTGAGNESYSSNAVTARSNSTSNSSYSVYEGSGGNNLFFAANAYFKVSGITLPGESNYVITFGSEKYLQSGDSQFKHDEFHVYISNDSKKWVELEYAFANGDQTGKWDLASSTFTIPAATSSLSIYVSADVASAYRLDDLCLSVSDTPGTAIDFSKGKDIDSSDSGDDSGDGDGDTAKEMTISEVLASAAGVKAIVTGTVAATYKRGFIITDGTDYLLVYDGSKCAAAEKDKVKVTGTTAAYGGLIQLSSPEVSVLSGGEALTLPEAKVLSAADFDAYSSTKIEYISYEGTLSVSGNYYNVSVPGASKMIGSLAYVNDSFNVSSYDKAQIKVTGFFVGITSSKYINTMVTEIEASSSPYLSVGTTSLSSKADDTSASFGITSNVDWTVTSDNAAYTVEPASGSGNATVTVKFAANAAESDVTVNLTVSTTAAVSPKSYAVTLTHKGKSSAPAEDYSSNVTWKLGENAYDKSSGQKGTVNDVEVDNMLKLGTKSVAGKATLTLPAGTKKVTFYAVAWTGTTATIVASVDSKEIKTWDVAGNTGATGNPPYKTITVTDSDKYSYSFDTALAAATEVELTTSKAARVILFAINAEK